MTVTALTLDLAFFALAGPAVLIAGISKGGFGSGAAFVSSVILAQAIDPGYALGVMLPLLMLIDIASLKPYWGRWRWQESRALLIGAVPGIVLAGVIFSWIDDNALRALIGAVAVAYVLWQVRPRASTPLRLPLWSGLPLGALAGFTSFVAHAGGPPAAVFLLSRGMTKTEYQACSVIVFWIINLVKFLPYAALGMFSAQTAIANIALAPFALIGTWIGVKLHHIIPERAFFLLANALLMITGLRLLWIGLIGDG